MCQQTCRTAAAVRGRAAQTARTGVSCDKIHYHEQKQWLLHSMQIDSDQLTNLIVSSVLFKCRCRGLSLPPEHYLRAWQLVGILLTKQQR